jgi:anti-anti-sigma factor
LHLSLDSREVGRVSIVRWYGRTVAGSESESLRAHVAWLLRDRRSIVLHLGDVGFIDSSGPGTMVRTLTSTRQARGRLDVAVTKKINLLKRGSFPGSCPVARYSARADIVKTNFSDDTPTLYLNRGDNNFE